MRETIKLAQKQGIAGIVIIGEPYYYPRFGFERAFKYKITDARGKSFDEIMVLPLNDDFSLIIGKLIECSDFEKLGDEAALLRISEEFPEYRKVKVKEGFMQIFEQHLGVVESVENDIYNVRYWENSFLQNWRVILMKNQRQEVMLSLNGTMGESRKSQWCLKIY